MDPIQNMQKKDGKKTNQNQRSTSALGGSLAIRVHVSCFFPHVAHVFFCGKHKLQTKIPHAKKATKKQYKHPTSQYATTIPKQKKKQKEFEKNIYILEHIYACIINYNNIYSDLSPLGFSKAPHFLVAELIS
jgi:hypothetical protein